MIDRLIALLVLCFVLGAPFGLTLSLTSELLLAFVFIYPLFMSVIWMAGGLYFWAHWERKWNWRPYRPPELKGNPLVTIVIPCYNEARHAEETIMAALGQDYRNIEVIAVNDGSSDETAQLFDRLTTRDPRLRVIHLARNQGKAMALRMGAMAARSDYLVCIDGDATLAPDAVNYLIAPLVDHPRVAAVTGNPRIRTRSTLIGRVQVGEFSSIIGLIKRTQRVYGQIFTVSGVCTAFRRQAIDQIGYWDLDMITEDIDITWKLQRAHWAVFFEPRALCWILMPETVRGLWKQRMRWAQGGAEVFIKNVTTIWRWNYCRLWPLMVDYFLSVLWAYALLLSIVLWVAGHAVALPPHLQVSIIVPSSFTGMVLALACLMQFLVSITIDRRYEPDLARALYWIIWYPFAFWLINFVTIVCSFPKVMLRIRRRRARWSSPDRGIKELT
ncbi:poly-beta-1,6 N-acetyl-D-glucosamine synthase [Pusillimonas sp. TS35]|uniref:poly-beta-1,6-N-acetyl-D-glucosamine synthase n=1 Tax=Paracandidimonas lactea TaxID=2895524 RepID=UPI001370CF6E|nr:poly-beta-1,6-N-acetyl-D-glucosamine synthase [Paracandidimonas lactea]MYN12056.1 poly-beta-1,6 N-acetyl-D-glucosamine synthase [Pusillimonas sp. TS35]